MATFLNFRSEESYDHCQSGFDADTTLKKNGFRNVNEVEAEGMLAGKAPYTYLVRPNPFARAFFISFVQPNGMVKHDHFSLLAPIYGIWRNGQSHHVGKLEKVICDMLNCAPYELKPL